MNAPFRLYGAELSPYSVKVRAYLRYKRLEFEWLSRNGARQEEFARYAKLPLIPVLVDASDNAFQDSTPIMERLEARFPEPSTIPPEASSAFLSALLEDYADEWLNKAMFHYRWGYPQDQESAARRIADMIFEGAEKPAGIEEQMRARMVGRLYHVGSSPETAPLIEASFTRVLALLEPILSARAYLFGGRPTFADFGLAAQLSQLLSDPTPGALMRAQAPKVVRWVERMASPAAEGAILSFDAVAASFASFLREEIASPYLSWMDANARAVAADAASVSVEIAGQTLVQKPQRYAAKALSELRRKRALVDDGALAALLEETGCDAILRAGLQDDATREVDDDDEPGDEDGED